jgi:hypothetical protein
MCIQHEEVLLLFGALCIVLYIWSLFVAFSLHRHERLKPSKIEIQTDYSSQAKDQRRPPSQR